MSNEFLKFSYERKKQILEGAESTFGIQPYYLEKDIWICTYCLSGTRDFVRRIREPGSRAGSFRDRHTSSNSQTAGTRRNGVRLRFSGDLWRLSAVSIVRQRTQYFPHQLHWEFWRDAGILWAQGGRARGPLGRIFEASTRL